MSSLSVVRGLFLFCCLLFASCVEHKDEKGDGSRPWEESRKFLPSDYVSTPWTAAHQAPPSMGFARQEYWSGLSAIKS